MRSRFQIESLRDMAPNLSVAGCGGRESLPEHAKAGAQAAAEALGAASAAEPIQSCATLRCREHTDEHAGRAGCGARVQTGPHSSGRPGVVIFCPVL